MLFQIAYQQQPVALVPLSDPMTQAATQAQNMMLANLLRAGANQPSIAGNDGDPTVYCMNLYNTTSSRLFSFQAPLSNSPSPNPAAASNLFTFMASRYSATYTTLNCAVRLNLFTSYFFRNSSVYPSHSL